MDTSDDNDIYFIFKVWVIVNLITSKKISRNDMLFWRGFSVSNFLLWNPITVLKLLRALSKSSTRSFNHLDLAFGSVHTAARCLLVLLAILFFIKSFFIQILLFCCFLSVYTCASSSTGWTERLHETTWLIIEKWNDPAHFQLTSCNSEAISTELTANCCVGFKMI